jgi:hypothetical protein
VGCFGRRNSAALDFISLQCRNLRARFLVTRSCADAEAEFDVALAVVAKATRTAPLQQQFGLRPQSSGGAGRAPQQQQQQSKTPGADAGTAAANLPLTSSSAGTTAPAAAAGSAVNSAVSASDSALDRSNDPSLAAYAAKSYSLQRSGSSIQRPPLDALLLGRQRELQILLGWDTFRLGQLSSRGASLSSDCTAAAASTSDPSLGLMLGMKGPLDSAASPTHAYAAFYEPFSFVVAGAAPFSALLSPLLRFLDGDAGTVSRPGSVPGEGASCSESLLRIAAIGVLESLVSVSIPCRAAFDGAKESSSWLREEGPNVSLVGGLAVSHGTDRIPFRRAAVSITVDGIAWTDPVAELASQFAATMSSQAFDGSGIEGDMPAAVKGGSPSTATVAPVLRGLQGCQAVRRFVPTLSLGTASVSRHHDSGPLRGSNSSTGDIRGHAAGLAAEASSRSHNDQVPMQLGVSSASMACALADAEALLRLQLLKALLEPVLPVVEEASPVLRQRRSGIVADVALSGVPIACAMGAADAVIALLTQRRLPNILRTLPPSAHPAPRRGRAAAAAIAGATDASLPLSLASVIAALRQADVALSLMTSCALHPKVAFYTPPLASSPAGPSSSSSMFLVQALAAVSHCLPAFSTGVVPPRAGFARVADLGRRFDESSLYLRLASACATCELQCLRLIARIIVQHGQPALLACAGSWPPQPELTAPPAASAMATTSDESPPSPVGFASGAGTDRALLIPRIVSSVRTRIFELLQWLAMVPAENLTLTRGASTSGTGPVVEVADYTCTLLEIVIQGMHLLLRFPQLPSIVDAAVAAAARVEASRGVARAAAGSVGVWELRPGLHVSSLQTALTAAASSFALTALPAFANLVGPLRLALLQTPPFIAAARDTSGTRKQGGSSSSPARSAGSGAVVLQGRLPVPAAVAGSSSSGGGAPAQSQLQPALASLSGAQGLPGSARKAARLAHGGTGASPHRSSAAKRKG